jgi:hypothetical protein
MDRRVSVCEGFVNDWYDGAIVLGLREVRVGRYRGRIREEKEDLGGCVSNQS